MILVLGVCLVCLAVGGLAFDGMRVILERRALQSVADSAARAAATRIRFPNVYAGKDMIRLDPERARARAVQILRTRPVDEVSVEVTESLVVIELRRHIETTFLDSVGIARLPVSASAAAEPVLGEV